MEHIVQFELSNEYLERFQQALDNKEDAFIISSLEGISHADITELLYEFDAEEQSIGSKYLHIGTCTDSSIG